MAAINPFALVQQQMAQAIKTEQQAAQSMAQKSAAASPPQSTVQQQTAAYVPLGTNTDEEILNKSPESWGLIQQAKNDYQRAQALGDIAGMNRAHQMAEQIRGQFGYSGGRDGSLYTPIGVQSRAQALYSSAIDDLERAQAAQQQALQAEIDRALLALSAQIPGIERSAADANTGAYETWLRASNPFGAAAQRQAQLGLLNSGFSESSLASLGNTYQSVVGQNEQAKLDSLRQIDLAREQAKLTGGIEKANQMAEFAKLIAEQRFKHSSGILDAAAQENAQTLAQRRLEYEMDKDERSQLETIAGLLARYGIFDGYRALGVTNEQIAAMEAYWRALQAV